MVESLYLTRKVVKRERERESIDYAININFEVHYNPFASQHSNAAEIASSILKYL